MRWRKQRFTEKRCGGDGLWIIVGLIVVFGGVIGLAELTGIPLETGRQG